MTDGLRLEDAEVRSLLREVMFRTYAASGYSQGCAYLVTPVTTGPRVAEWLLGFPFSVSSEESAPRTPTLLRSELQARGRLAEWEKRVIRPNAADAQSHALVAEQGLARAGYSGLRVFNPAGIDLVDASIAAAVRSVWLREDYVTLHRRVLTQWCQAVLICPGSEYGTDMSTPLSVALERGMPILDLEGHALTAADLAARRAAARQELSDRGFTDDEAAALVAG